MYHLTLAKELGHPESEYTSCFFKLLNKRQSIRDEGVEELASINSKYQGIVRVCQCMLSLRMRIMDMNLPEADEVKVQKFCTPQTKPDHNSFLH